MKFNEFSAEAVNKIIDEMPVFVIAFDSDGKVLLHNKTASAICAKKIDEARYEDIFLQEYRAEEDVDKLEYECWIGGRCYSVTDFIIEYVCGSPARFITGHDITDVKNYILSYNNQSMVDPMTGIFNRQVGIDFLNEMMNQVRLGEDPFSISFIDLDNLKTINDNHGHSKGDEYIFAVCEAVKSTIRKTDVFSRLGGDEFLLIFPQCTTKVATMIMNKIIAKLDKANEALPHGIKYRISYGVQDVDPFTVITTESLMDSVDAKMYSMKADHQEADGMNK
ncbi:MAG: GGDEF domain-containing protein [Defluviitaleaceae bacterium]|nr:GGDEF domain-containing protein [Defluviitaleaceae bacterium]